MYIAWVVLAYIMFASKRYLGFLGMVGMYIHALCGYAICVITIYQGIKGIQKLGGLKFTIHTVLGFGMFCLIPILTFSGSGIMMLGKSFNKIKRWQSHKEEASFTLKKFHCWLGYGMLFVGILVTTSGILVYKNPNPVTLENPKDTRIAMISNMCCFMIPLISEIIFRNWRRMSTRELSTSKSKHSMTVEEFKVAVFEKKKQMVIMDNCVLDMDEYAGIHPGGKFVLEKTVGRDVSKFFYGGYQMVSGAEEFPFNHSALAMSISQTFVVANLAGQEHVAPILTQMAGKEIINSIATMFTLKTTDSKKVHDFKLWYSEFTKLGQHFLVYGQKNMTIKRQYTICSSIEPKFYQALCDSVDAVLSA